MAHTKVHKVALLPRLPEIFGEFLALQPRLDAFDGSTQSGCSIPWAPAKRCGLEKIDLEYDLNTLLLTRGKLYLSSMTPKDIYMSR